MNYSDLYSKSISYNEYDELFERLNNEKRTTGIEQNENLINYIQLNWQRNKRVKKKIIPSDDVIQRINTNQTKSTIFVITEPWCGDSVFSLTPLGNIQQAGGDIDIRVILRDQEEDVINNYLTNGSKSIPKMILFRGKHEVTTWGPRPKELSELIMKFKSTEGFTKEELAKKIQLWYNKDKGEQVFYELEKMINS